MARTLTPPCAFCMQQGRTCSDYLLMGVREPAQFQGMPGVYLTEVAQCRGCWKRFNLPIVCADGKGGEKYVETTYDQATGRQAPNMRLNSPMVEVPRGPGATAELARRFGLGGIV